MATLADLFNKSSTDIYNKFPADRNQLVVINQNTTGRLGRTTSTIKYDTRALPISSTVRDVVRVSRLLDTPSGALTLAKQTLLQTGNTFENTKLYNPLSILANTVPFTYVLRSIKQDAYLYLQSQTIKDAASKFQFIIGLNNQITNENIVANIRQGIQLYGRPEKHAFYNYARDVWTGPRLYAHQAILERGKKKLTVEPLSTADNQNYPTEFVQAATAFRENFNKKTLLTDRLDAVGKRHRLRSSYINDGKTTDNETIPTLTQNASSVTAIFDQYNKEKPFTRDSNILSDDRLDYGNIITPQDTLNSEGKTDIIKFIFSEAGGQNTNPVQFRALLSSIKESIKPEFNDQRYVGRTERFVTYSGAKRSVNMSFNIVAFSVSELSGVWSRVNYLSGLAFPKGVSNGFMIPPLFNITIGNIYDNQPCYIETLDYDFLDDTLTFDIENEVPFAIKVTMQVSLLEKRSKFYNSPFYAIAETIRDNQITAARSAAASTSPQTAEIRTTVTPPIQQQTVVVPDSRDGFTRNFSLVELQSMCNEDAQCIENLSTLFGGN